MRLVYSNPKLAITFAIFRWKWGQCAAIFTKNHQEVFMSISATGSSSCQMKQCSGSCPLYASLQYTKTLPAMQLIGHSSVCAPGPSGRHSWYTSLRPPFACTTAACWLSYAHVQPLRTYHALCILCFKGFTAYTKLDMSSWSSTCARMCFSTWYSHNAVHLFWKRGGNAASKYKTKSDSITHYTIRMWYVQVCHFLNEWVSGIRWPLSVDSERYRMSDIENMPRHADLRIQWQLYLDANPWVLVYCMIGQYSNKSIFFSTDLRQDAEHHRELTISHHVRKSKMLQMQPLNAA